MDLRLRRTEYRQFLYKLRKAAPGVGMDLQLRYPEHRKLLF